MLNTIRSAETRVSETPNATMRTLASPTLGSTAGVSMWQVEMEAGASGPLHVFDSEQVWTVLDGEARVSVGEDTAELAPGDTVVLPAGAERQVAARTAVRMLVCGHGDAIVRVPGEPSPRGTPAWIV
ncbi:MAG: cupin domain-containing protein [Solirubrobacteraceae bacterium]